MKEIPKTAVEWLSCIGLDDYIAMTPVGHIAYIVGPELWIDGNGNRMTYEQYKARWGVDPKVAWEAVKSYRREAGKIDHTMRL